MNIFNQEIMKSYTGKVKRYCIAKITSMKFGETGCSSALTDYNKRKLRDDIPADLNVCIAVIILGDSVTITTDTVVDNLYIVVRVIETV